MSSCRDRVESLEVQAEWVVVRFLEARVEWIDSLQVGIENHEMALDHVSADLVLLDLHLVKNAPHHCPSCGWLMTSDDDSCFL